MSPSALLRCERRAAFMARRVCLDARRLGGLARTQAGRGPCWREARSLLHLGALRAAGACRSTGSAAGRDAGEPAPAHLSYDPGSVGDMPTLLLLARSALASGYRDAGFWRSCSLQAQRMLGSDAAPLAAVAQFAEAAAEAQYRDEELIYNVGDAAVGAGGALDTDTLAAVLRSHALLGFGNDRVLSRLEGELFQQMQQSRLPAAVEERVSQCLFAAPVEETAPALPWPELN